MLDFLVYEARKGNRRAWVAIDLERDWAYAFKSPRHIERWCRAYAARTGQVARIVAGELNQIDSAI